MGDFRCRIEKPKQSEKKWARYRGGIQKMECSRAGTLTSLGIAEPSFGDIRGAHPANLVGSSASAS